MKKDSRNMLIALVVSAMLLGIFASCAKDPPANDSPANETTNESTTGIITESVTESDEATTESSAESTEAITESTAESTAITTESTTESTEETTESTTESTEVTTESTTESTETKTESTTESTAVTTELTTESTEETTESTTESTEETTESTTESTEETTESTTESTEETTESTMESTEETTESTVESTEETTEFKCEHQNLGAWYYYDDGKADTNELREARDCADCEEKMVETRKAATYGYFQKIDGNASYGGSGVGKIDLSSKNVTASDKGELKIQFFMALTSGGFDTAVYKITDNSGNESDWITLATRGNGITGVDANTMGAMSERGFDGENTSLITNKNAIDLSAYGDQTVTVTLAVISKAAEDAGLEDKYVICATFVNVAVPKICFHENLTDWYYYDDGDASTNDALEARDCADCGTAKLETRKATYKGYFMNVSGEGASGGMSPAMNIDLAGKAVAPTNRGALTVQYWLALENGGFDNAYYKVTTSEGESEWMLMASRGSGISSADAGTQNSLTSSGFDGANMGVVRATLDLKAYGQQTVSIAFAIVPSGASELDDKYVVFASFTNVAIPAIDERPAAAEIYYGSSIKVNDGNASTPSTSKGTITLTGITVDENCQINLNGWCAVDGGVYKYVWSVDGGATWREDFVNAERIKTTTTEAIVTSGQAYSGKTFKDLEGAYTNAQFQNGGIGIDLSDYKGETVDVVFAAVPIVNSDVKIILCNINDVICPAE